jgi:glycolate oxidase
MLDKRIIGILAGIVGREHVSTEKADRICYSYDATQKQHYPDVVVRPADTQQISLILKMANAEGIPVYPRGAASGFTGGSVPIHGGIALVLTRLNRILRIDEDNLIAEVEPGVVTAQLQEAVEARGLFYPPDPASLKFSTLGGNVAECAGGPRCVKYGVTKDYVLGLEVVTPQGDIIRTGGETMKGVVGYDLTKLMVGSEGTLGVITRIIFKLIPKPEAKKTMLVMFDAIDGAAEAVSSIIRGKIIPTTLEFMDATAIDCVRRNAGLEVPASARALLIIEVDGDPELLERQAQRILDIAAPLGVVETRVAASAEESEQIWRVRRSVSPSLRKVNPDKYNEDICVPRSRLPDMIRAIEEISQRLEIPIVNFGHAGDGNIHVNILVDHSIAGHADKAETAVRDIFAKTLELGGTMSGEHGVGLSKAPYIPMELDPATTACMKAIKRALDPNNILNPGKIFLED